MNKKKILRIIFISIIILLGIIDILLAIVLYNEIYNYKNISSENDEIPENFYTSTIEYNSDTDDVIIYDNTILIKSQESIDINGIKWITVNIPTFNIVIDIPEKLLSDKAIVRNDNEDNLEIQLDNDYILRINKKDITDNDKESFIIDLNNAEDNEDTSKINLIDGEEQIGSCVGYSLSESTHIVISSFKNEELAEFGYKYTILRENNLTDISFTSSIEYMNSEDNHIVTYLRQFVNMIRIVD